MTIESFFKTYGDDAVIFDPIISYKGNWSFSIENLKLNSIIDKNTNLFEEYYKKTFIEPMNKLFNSSAISNFKIKMMCMLNEDNKGRSLRYSKMDFYINLTLLLNKSIDKYKHKNEDMLEMFTNMLDKAKEGDLELNTAFSNAFRDKAALIKDVLDKEIESEYFDAAQEDYLYDSYNMNISFHDYLKNEYDEMVRIQRGVLKVSDFFLEKLDYKELAKCFEKDKLYLLFAYIIYNNNRVRIRNNKSLGDNFGFVVLLKNALKIIVKENYNYNIIIKVNNHGYIKRYDLTDFFEEYISFVSKYPYIKDMEILKIDIYKNSDYRDLSLVENLKLINNSEINKNFNKVDENDYDDYFKYLNSINVLTKPFKGLNDFKHYYAYLLRKDIVVLETESLYEPAYLISLEDFISLAKNEILFKDYKEDIKYNYVRIFHSDINHYKRNIIKYINGTYDYKEVLKYINNIRKDA